MRDSSSVYLDHAATTPVDPRVVDVMRRMHLEDFGNPSSVHGAGVAAHRAIETVRRQLAAHLGTSPEGVVFTSGATEANNLAVRGLARARQRRGRHLLLGSTEHASILETGDALASEGFEVETLPCDPSGRILPEEIRRHLRDDTIVVAVMLGNNETGTLSPVRDLARFLAARPSPPAFHVDAVQGFPGLPIHLDGDRITSVALSAHKFHGPKGVGTLAVAPGTRIVPLIQGGGQESGLRSGTENVAGVVGMGEAFRIAAQTVTEDHRRMARLRDRLAAAILSAVPGCRRLGSTEFCLPHIVNLGFPGIPGEVLVHHLDREGVAVSTGSACSERRRAEASRVLLAMGVPSAVARGSIRFSLARTTTADEIDRTIATVVRVHRELEKEIGVR